MKVGGQSQSGPWEHIHGFPLLRKRLAFSGIIWAICGQDSVGDIVGWSAIRIFTTCTASVWRQTSSWWRHHSVTITEPYVIVAI